MNSNFPKKVVVLGASGFVGRALTKGLESHEIPVLGTSSKDLDLTADDASSRLKDLISPSDSVVMVSAFTPDKGRDVGTLMKNLKMSQAVAAFFDQGGLCEHLIYISSDAVYSDSEELIRESSPCNPGSFHGVMHLAREVMLRASLEKAKIPYLALRPCAVYGAQDTHNSYGPNRFIRTAQKEQKIKLFGGGEEIRDHVFVDDLSRIVIESLRQRCTGVLNVASGRAISFGRLAEKVAQFVGGGKTQIEFLPRTGPVSHRHFDISKTAQFFPAFSFTELEEGLKLWVSV